MLLGKVNALAVFATWGLMGALFAYFIYAKLVLPPDGDASLFFWLVGLFACAALVHAVLAYFVRCPNCQKCLTVQGFKEPHPATSGGWQKVVTKCSAALFSAFIVVRRCKPMVYNKHIMSPLRGSDGLHFARSSLHFSRRICVRYQP